MGVSQKTRTVTGATTLDAHDAIVFGDTTGGAFTITLPSAAAWGAGNGGVLSLKKIVASVNALTIAAEGGQTINGLASITLADNTGAEFVSNGGTVWHSY